MKYVALLRAINVGGHMVKMDHLRSLFETMGFSNVETFIASGNVIFDSKIKSTASLEKKIEKQLHATLGYEVKTFLRTIDELSRVTSDRPFGSVELDKSGYILYVGFMSAEPPAANQKKLMEFADKVNEFQVKGREVYWLRNTGAGESEYSGGMIEKMLGVPTTFRNINTVNRLVKNYPTS